MFCLVVYMAAFSMLGGSAAVNQAFTRSGEMNISSCPITYYGEKYDKVYVGFDADRFAVCFNGAYTPGIKNDCILMSGGTADRGDLVVLTREIPTGSGVHKLLPNLKNAGQCVNVIPLKDNLKSDIEQVELGNFGTQAILAIKTYSGYTSVDVEADALVEGVTVSKLVFQTNETSRGVITDVSGCRLSGAVYKTNTTVHDTDNCATVTCHVSGVATAVSNCGPTERCQGNGSCIMNAVCSVTGSTVIDFIDRVHTVPDRCTYSLLTPSAIPDFQVLGVFQDRRRKDVSFLDQVILKVGGDGTQISLEQAGRVLVNNVVLTLKATAQVVHGVELSRDQAGVTAKISTSNYSASVLFDGNTALIHMTGPSGTPVQGLCGDSIETLSNNRVSEDSAADCQMKHSEGADSTIDCHATTEWCNILKQATFTDCNMYIDPEPYITACTQTLCKYPAADGLQCQFLKAYAQACRQQSNVTLKAWESDTSCAAVRPGVCPDRFCSEHEFCGQDSLSGETRCLCRAIFASAYTPTDSFGEPILCQGTSASLTMANCLLEDKGIDYTVLHLNDQACKGKMDNLTHMVTFSFDKINTCGTVIMPNNSQIIYKNTIRSQNVSMFGLITRHGPVYMDFSCYYSQPEEEIVAIRLKHSSVFKQMLSGAWSYNLTMKAYTSLDLTEVIDANTEIGLNEPMWVELRTEGLDEEIIAVVTDSCWATDQPSPNGGLRYDLIINGCPNPTDQTVEVVGNGLGTSNYFSFRTFQFSGSSSDVYLHCGVQLCVKEGNTCIPNCRQGLRRRRSAMRKHEDDNLDFITMAWGQ